MIEKNDTLGNEMLKPLQATTDNPSLYNLLLKSISFVSAIVTVNLSMAKRTLAKSWHTTDRHQEPAARQSTTCHAPS